LARTRRQSRVQIFYPGAAAASHNCSRSFALLLITEAVAEWIDKVSGQLRLKTAENWKSLKLRIAKRDVPKSNDWKPINPADSYHVMCLQQYPPTPHSALDKANQEMIWMRAEKFLGAV